MPNVIVTPHNSIGRSPLAVQRAIDAFLANLARYVLGDALLHEMNGTDFPDP